MNWCTLLGPFVASPPNVPRPAGAILTEQLARDKRFRRETRS